MNPQFKIGPYLCHNDHIIQTDEDIVEALQSYNGKLDITDKDTGKTLLQIAVIFGLKKSFDELIRLGADVNSCPGQGGTALREAEIVQNQYMIDVLLKNNAKKSSWDAHVGPHRPTDIHVDPHPPIILRWDAHVGPQPTDIHVILRCFCKIGELLFG